MCKDVKTSSGFSAIYGACISQPDDLSSGDIYDVPNDQQVVIAELPQVFLLQEELVADEK
ncbi:MAG: hypothetical protein ONB46_08510 [candidate division KSB1 bacterium]|nr:hypothetical protein [candidate division KSB1 bacterium]MDZ7365935.1 hypothetical protein [candidate division KSB1 bacterium]